MGNQDRDDKDSYPSREAIARRAFLIWEGYGKRSDDPNGETYWLMAEQLLIAQGKSNG